MQPAVLDWHHAGPAAQLGVGAASMLSQQIAHTTVHGQLHAISLALEQLLPHSVLLNPIPPHTRHQVCTCSNLATRRESRHGAFIDSVLLRLLAHEGLQSDVWQVQGESKC